MDDQERIDNGNFKLGFGLVISDLFKEEMSENKDLILIPLVKKEIIKYEGKLKEIQIICKNEKLVFTCSRYMISNNDRNKKNHTILDEMKLILVKEMDYMDDAPNKKESLKIGQTFKKLRDYLQVEAKCLNFFLYFPEKIIIDNDGEGLAKIVKPSELKYLEKFKEFGGFEH